MRTREVTVNDELSVFAARNAVREAAHEMGFDTRACEELVIAASELASNIVKHAQLGTFVIDEATHHDHGRGIRLTAGDAGPPFASLAMAIQDGCDDRGPIAHDRRRARSGGLAVGLGAVARFTDSLDVDVDPSGKRVRAVRYLRRPR